LLPITSATRFSACAGAAAASHAAAMAVIAAHLESHLVIEFPDLIRGSPHPP
jgi:hypothetical protein